MHLFCGNEGVGEVVLGAKERGETPRRGSRRTRRNGARGVRVHEGGLATLSRKSRADELGGERRRSAIRSGRLRHRRGDSAFVPSTGIRRVRPGRFALLPENRDATSAAAAPGDVPAPSTSTSAATPLSARADPAFPDARRLPENRAPTSSAATVGVPRFGPGVFVIVGGIAAVLGVASPVDLRFFPENRAPTSPARASASRGGAPWAFRVAPRAPSICCCVPSVAPDDVRFFPENRAPTTSAAGTKDSRGGSTSPPLVPEHARATGIFHEGFRRVRRRLRDAVAAASSTRINSGLERRRGSPRVSTASSASSPSRPSPSRPRSPRRFRVDGVRRILRCDPTPFVVSSPSPRTRARPPRPRTHPSGGGTARRRRHRRPSFRLFGIFVHRRAATAAADDTTDESPAPSETPSRG